MLSHTLKSLAIDDAMYASESYWELCVRYRYLKVLFGKPIFQSKYMAKIQNLKNVCTFISYMQSFEQKENTLRFIDPSFHKKSK